MTSRVGQARDLTLLGAVRWLALLSTGLCAGVALAHLLERPNKLALLGQDYLLVQQHVYEGFGRVIGPLEVVALLAATGSAALLWRRRGPVWPSLVAVVSIAAALVVWQFHNGPVNAAVASWTPATLPTDWATYRDRWENAHALRAALYILALAALSLPLPSGQVSVGQPDRRFNGAEGEVERRNPA